MATSLKVKKISDNWRRITISTDKWDLADEVVDIIKTEWNEWSVCDDSRMYDSLGERARDHRRYVFVKISEAKKFALDLAEAIMNETDYPSLLDDKYSVC